MYARLFPTVELNATFYRMQREETFRRQAPAAPEGFVFAVKAHRSITHEMRLEGVETQWRKFVSSVAALEDRLGPVLLQFPPSFRCRTDLLERFIERHEAGFGKALRLAFEFRHASWFEGEAVGVLRAHGAAMVVADSSRYPRAPLEASPPFAYLRFHGPGAMFASSYSDVQLREWGQRIGAWLAEGLDVYAYFNNDAEGCAVRNALRLRELAGEGQGSPRPGGPPREREGKTASARGNQ